MWAWNTSPHSGRSSTYQDRVVPDENVTGLYVQEGRNGAVIVLNGITYAGAGGRQGSDPSTDVRRQNTRVI